MRIARLCSISDLTLSRQQLEKNLVALKDDWDWIIEEGTKQRILGLVYYLIKTHGLEQMVPKTAFDRIQSIFYAAQHASLQYEILLEEISNKCKDIEFLVIKGCAIEALIYPMLGTRFATDLDLIINKNQRHIMNKRLQSMGYQLVLPGLTKDVWLAKTAFEPLYVEIHARLIPYTSFQTLWHRSQQIKLTRTFVRTLGWSDQFVYLSFHLAFEHFHNAKLVWCHDIKMLLDVMHEKLDFSFIVQDARRSHMKSILDNCVTLLQKTYGLKNPHVPFRNGRVYSRLDIEKSDLWDGKVTVMNRGVKYLIFFDNIFKGLLIMFIRTLYNIYSIFCEKFK